MYSETVKLAQYKTNVICSLWKTPRKKWAAHWVLAGAFALSVIDFWIFSKSHVFSLWYDKCCKAKWEGGGCTSTKLDDTKEREASFIIVQKSNYACWSFCTSLYAALNAAFHIFSQKERASVFEGNQCLWFVWGRLLIFLLSFLQTISLYP